MLGRMLGALAAMVLTPACVSPAGQDGGGQPTLAFVGVTVVPMTGGEATLPDRTVLIRGGRIDRIGPRARVKVPAGAQIVDGRGRYLLPGLSDMHVHLEYVEDPNVLKLFIANGVTTVRSMDGRPFIREWRDRVKAGALLGPRIVTAGPIIDGSPPARDDNLAVADEASARAAVAAQAAEGYDFVKLYTNLSASAYEGAVAEAGRRRLRIAGHVPRAVEFERALEAQWSIEHLGDFAAAVAAEGGAPVPGWARRTLAAPLDSARVQALAERLATAGVWVLPTAIQQDRWLAPPDQVAEWLKEPAIARTPAPVVEQWKGALERFSSRLDAEDWALLEQARRNRLALILAFHRRGVRLAIGSDTPNAFVAMGASVHQELANFVAAGLTPIEALRAATVNPAQMLGLQSEQGTIERGKRADLVLLAGNPLEDVGHAARPVGVLAGGRWFDGAGLRALAADWGRKAD
jgi:hypothetical protein